jgi:tetratricopeptide (TPR) repeat protein
VYKIAGNMKEDERYPAKQLALIQYHKLVAKANEHYEGKDYEKALKYYDRASKIKPDDTSFTKQHAKCRRKMN